MTISTDSIPLSTSGLTALEVAIRAARLAGDIISNGFHLPKKYRYKAPHDPVTSIDLKSEQSVKELLTKEFPDFGIVAEESGVTNGRSEFCWFVDPLDGTRNFVAGIPHFCSAIALAYGDQVLVAATYDPIRQELFQAELGKGAYLNGNRVEISSKNLLSDCLIGFDMGPAGSEREGNALDIVLGLWHGIRSVRAMGSAGLGLAYAANARVDIYFHQYLSPWDLAGGLLLVHEAGGAATDRYGNQATPASKSIIVSSSNLLNQFLEQTHGASKL